MLKRILTIILFTFLALLLSLNVLSITHHSLFGLRVYRISTPSMEPTLPVGSLILIKSDNTYEVGDVVTFKDGEDYTTHRIFAIIGDDIVTKGDANDSPDSQTITKDKIVGKVVLNFMRSRFINYLLLEPFTWVLLFILGIGITIFIPNKSKREEKKETTTEGS